MEKTSRDTSKDRNKRLIIRGKYEEGSDSYRANTYDN